jgi:sulfate transport system ATP-binding protein
MSIGIEAVTKRFGEYVAVDGVSLTIPEGQLVALLGPSGSGKTTLLRIVAGLERPDSGRVSLNGVDMTSAPARDRRIGFVFQHYALFPHMTVAENVGFALKVRGVPRSEIEAAASELLRLVRLEGFERRLPSQLSGGQRQRVALARALASRPSVLLLDEPFGALDARVRQELRRWLRRLHDDAGVTSVFVTHDQEEALQVADRIVVMNHGRVEQEGSPQEMFDHPRTPFVMGFLGAVNIFHGRVENGHAVFGGLQERVHGSDGQSARGFARPHELDIDRAPLPQRSLPARVNHVYPSGGAVRVELVLSDGRTLVQADIGRDRYAELRLSPGDPVFVAPRQLRIFVE